MRNIIFDIDGTLWDTTEVVAKAWSRALKEIGGTSAIITSEVLKKEFGKTMEVIADDLFFDADKHKREQLMELCCKYEEEAISEVTDNLLYPKVKDTIIKLSKKYCLFIVSNCQSGYIELFMEKAGIEEYITDYESYGNTGRGKGENIKRVLERNSLEDVVYVGDTQGDYEATVFAEIPFIYAKYGFGSPESCYLAINSIDELLNFS
ncbi:HAD family hydrolase [Candidatus Clostridium radicumherbarum]|uniref:HAD family hydrolase n=1 Tax=Candidatus Clostridium radicumherbarum TaxID=3381662 RepID=A0ABW8TSZ4_9CLOT